MRDLRLRMSDEEKLQAYTEGRKLGARINHERALKSRAAWREKARRLIKELPYLHGDDLAVEVFKWARSNAIKMKNGKCYQFGTILKDLREQGITNKN